MSNMKLKARIEKAKADKAARDKPAAESSAVAQARAATEHPAWRDRIQAFMKFYEEIVAPLARDADAILGSEFRLVLLGQRGDALSDEVRYQAVLLHPSGGVDHLYFKLDEKGAVTVVEKRSESPPRIIQKVALEQLGRDEVEDIIADFVCEPYKS